MSENNNEAFTPEDKDSKHIQDPLFNDSGLKVFQADDARVKASEEEDNSKELRERELEEFRKNKDKAPEKIADPKQLEMERLYRELFGLRNLVNENPENEQYRFDLAMVLYELGKIQEATENLQTILEKNSHNEEAIHWLVHCLIEQGFTERALGVYDSAIKSNPEKVDLYLRKHALFQERGDVGNARQTLEQAFDNGIVDPQIHSLMAESCYLMGDYEEMIALLSEFEETDKLTQDDLSKLGMAYFHRNDVDKALKLLEKSDAISGNHFATKVNLGILYSRLNRLAEAEEAYIKSIELNGENTIPWFNLGEIYFNQERFVDAEKIFKHLTRMNQNDGEVWYYLGRLNAMKNTEYAKICLDKAISLNFNRQDLKELQSDIFEKNNDLREAISIREQIRISQPHHENNNKHLLRLYANFGDIEKVEALIETVGSFSKDDIELLFGLSQAFRMKMKRDAELTTLEIIVKLDKDHDQAKIRICKIAFDSGYFMEAYRLQKRLEVKLPFSGQQILIFIISLLREGKSSEAFSLLKDNMDTLRPVHKFWTSVFRQFKRLGFEDEILKNVHILIDPKHIAPYDLVKMLENLEMIGFIDKALEIGRSYVKTHADSTAVYVFMASAMMRANRLGDAYALILGRTEETSDPELKLTLAECHLKLNEQDKVPELIDSLPSGFDKHYKVPFLRGILATMNGNKGEAFKHYSEAAELNSDDYRVYYNHSLTGLALDKTDELRHSVERFLELNPNHSNCRMIAGDYYKAHEDLNLAKIHYMKALVLNKKNRTAWNRLGQLFEDMSQLKKSRLCFKEAEEMS